MFTDMVGYTALGQRNESLSLALVDEQRKLIRPILDRHNGREVKTIGDAFLVEFSSALDAVRCAYDVQRAIREFNFSSPEERRIHLRVGVHLGDVVESEGDIRGDAVNVASRIESLAEDGGICLTRQVFDHVRNKFDLPLKSLGHKSLKNVNLPVEVYKIVMPWDEEKKAEPPTQFDRKRIAILPFANISPDPGDEYFADGLTEEMISSLSQLPKLQVIARTSVMSYKVESKHVSTIGEDLKVGSVLEGSVRKSGKKIRITVQLIDVASESHLWSSSYDRDLDDIFAIQSDVAKRVAEALQVHLLPAERQRLEKSPTSNIEAYTLYLKGLFYANRVTEESFRKAIACHEEALANDPDFAAAYAELASCYTFLGFFGMLPSKEAGAKARACAKKALELDDSLAEAHAAMGNILRLHDWDFQAAEREYKRAMRLNSSLAEAYSANARLEMFNRRFDEAIVEAKHALELDPLSGETSQPIGAVFLYSGRYDDAVEQFEKALKIDPDSAFARGNLGLAYIQKGMIDAGVKEVLNVATIKNPSSQSDLAYAYAKASRYEDLKKLLNELLREVGRNSELAFAVASAYANLGDRDRALEWLERAYAEHVSLLVSANADFVFDTIRSDPRFQALMKKIGFTNT